MLDHLVGILVRALIAQVTGAKPLQVQPDRRPHSITRAPDQKLLAPQAARTEDFAVWESPAGPPHYKSARIASAAEPVAGSPGS